VAIACESNEIDVLGDGSQCEAAKFTITTTNMSANTEFKFYMSASGTFYVDWGDGTVDTITRNDTTSTLYSHTYPSGGVKIIQFGGLATGYYSGSGILAAIKFPGDWTSGSLLAAISGSIGQIFPTLGTAPDKQPTFSSTFTFTKITSIPENLFSGVTGCRPYMFYATFEQSRSIKSIPDGLFSGITGGADYMFAWTFNSCLSIKAIPDKLFSGITETAPGMFYRTFSYTGLVGYIPENLFKGIEGQEYKTGMMNMLFYEVPRLVQNCPTGTSQYITGYEEYWDGHVACTPHTHDCDSGTYFPTTIDGCVACPENNYCPGGEYTYNGVDQGIIACPVGLYAPMGMSSSNQCGRILHIGENVVYLHSTKKTTPALHVDIDQDGTADYFGNMTTLDIPMTRGTERKLKLQYDGVTYSVYDDSVDLSEYQN
jgi:hypothetical protein